MSKLQRGWIGIGALLKVGKIYILLEVKMRLKYLFGYLRRHFCKHVWVCYKKNDELGNYDLTYCYCVKCGKEIEGKEE